MPCSAREAGNPTTHRRWRPDLAKLLIRAMVAGNCRVRAPLQALKSMNSVARIRISDSRFFITICGNHDLQKLALAQLQPRLLPDILDKATVENGRSFVQTPFKDHIHIRNVQTIHRKRKLEVKIQLAGLRIRVSTTPV